MLPPVLERLPDRGRSLLLRAGRHLPEPRAEPAPAREPRVHHAEDARGGRRPRGRVRRRRRPLLLRRRHRRVRPGRLRHRAARRVGAREGAGREGDLRRPRELGRAGDDRARRRRCRWSTASATRSSSTGCARRAPSSAARSRRTTTSATSRRPTRASSRSCSCSSWSRSAAGSCRSSSRRFRERYFLTGELNTPVADVALKLQELKERFARGHGLAPRRHLGRVRRLALQRAPVEHRAAAAPQPRGALAGADGAEARRGAGADPLIASSGASPTGKPPFKYSALTRVGFSDTDAQGIVYYGRYLPVLRPRARRVPPPPRPERPRSRAASS